MCQPGRAGERGIEVLPEARQLAFKGTIGPRQRFDLVRQHRQPGLAHPLGVCPGPRIDPYRLRQSVRPVFCRRRRRDRTGRRRFGRARVQLQPGEQATPRMCFGTRHFRRALAQHDLAFRHQTAPLGIRPHRVVRLADPRSASVRAEL